MALSKLAVRRLTKLADYMAKLPKSAERHFNMRYWFLHDGADHFHDVGAYITPTVLKFCGTSACAMGWAATIPSFKKAGLVVEAVKSSAKPFDRGMKFFDLSAYHFLELFGSDNNDKTPKTWAKRCRAFIKANS